MAILNRILIALLVLMLLSGCESDELKEIYRKQDLREYKETKEGVEYFTTCAEGFVFIVSGRQAMAGPIGKCGE